ncbi:MAG: enoyl-CoA hydratase [Pirellulales bacterium]
MSLDAVRSDLSGSIATITLARPAKRNALSHEMLGGLRQAFLAVPATVRVVVLQAEGPTFSAGHDLKEMVDQPADFYQRLFRDCRTTMEAIHQVPQPVVAKVQGPATAAGCQLVASCDLAIAAETAWFATPGVRIGLFCTTPMVPIVRSVGRKRAMEMLLTGEPIDARTAADWGLINRAVPADDLDDTVERLVGKIASWSPETTAIGKRAFYAQIDLPESAAYEVALPIIAGNATTADAQEGIRAFLEKRSPRWMDR